MASSILPLSIRKETPQDYDAIHRLITDAFATAELADGNEQDLVAALRTGTAYIPDLSLVAETDGELVGHILFTSAQVGGAEVLALAPLSVKPACQRRGIGSALIAEGHRIARESGYSYSVVLGSTSYYPRFGYLPAQRLGILPPEGIPADHLMAIRLLPDTAPIHGPIIYAAAFGI